MPLLETIRSGQRLGPLPAACAPSGGPCRRCAAHADRACSSAHLESGGEMVESAGGGSGRAASNTPRPPCRLPMPAKNVRMLVQELPIELVERVAGFVRIPALRYRRRLTPPPGQPLQRPYGAGLRGRLAARPRPRPRQPTADTPRPFRGRDRRCRCQIRPSVGSFLESLPLQRATRRSAEAPASRCDPPLPLVIGVRLGKALDAVVAVTPLHAPVLSGCQGEGRA